MDSAAQSPPEDVQDTALADATEKLANAMDLDDPQDESAADATTTAKTVEADADVDMAETLQTAPGKEAEIKKEDAEGTGLSAAPTNEPGENLVPWPEASSGEASVAPSQGNEKDAAPAEAGAKSPDQAQNGNATSETADKVTSDDGAQAADKPAEAGATKAATEADA